MKQHLLLEDAINNRKKQPYSKKDNMFFKIHRNHQYSKKKMCIMYVSCYDSFKHIYPLNLLKLILISKQITSKYQRVQSERKDQLYYGKICQVLELILNFFAMTFVKRIKSIISSADLFYSSQLLRYDNDTQYKTVTGGLITLGIIIMVIVGFTSMISDTLNRTAITSTLNSVKSRNPPFFQLIPSAETKFMFGLQIQSTDISFVANLNSGPRFFDVNMQIQQINYGVLINTTNVALVKCTDDHWKILPQMVQNKQLYGYDSWLCPQIGQKLPIQGSYTSKTNFIIAIMVGPCNNQTNPDMLCAPQDQIDALMNQYTNFYFAVNYINAVINPSETNYISYYLQGEDYVIFSKTQGSEAWFSFSDYLINTDNSILPFTDLKSDIGIIIQNKAINHPFSSSNSSGYVTIFFQKSANSLIYNRTVQKISAVFSYIGGLIGALTAVLFLLKAYTDASLQLTIALSLFKETREIDLQQSELESNSKTENFQEPGAINLQGFNFISFLQLTVYKIFSTCHFSNRLKKAKLLSSFQEEIKQQLDIKTLLRRIISLENCIQSLLNKQQLQILKYSKNVELRKARELRQQLVPIDIEDLSFKQVSFLFSNKIADSMKKQGNMKQINMISPENFIESGQNSEIEEKKLKKIVKVKQSPNNQQNDYFSQEEVKIPKFERQLYRKPLNNLLKHPKKPFQRDSDQHKMQNEDHYLQKFIKSRGEQKMKTDAPQKSIKELRGIPEKKTERIQMSIKGVQFKI